MKLFGNRRRAAHTKKSALPRGTRTALIAAVIVLWQSPEARLRRGSCW